MTLDWNGLIAAIRVERARRQWSQADLAERASVSITTIKNLEGGRDYQKPPVAPLMAVDRAFEWPIGTLESILRQDEAAPAATSEPPAGAPKVKAADKNAEDVLATRYRREPVPEGDALGMIHNIVYKVVGTAAPETSLAEFQRLEDVALEIASRYGFIPARRDDEASADDSQEPPVP